MESLERFAEVMSDEEPEPQMLTPYALDRKTALLRQGQKHRWAVADASVSRPGASRG